MRQKQNQGKILLILQYYNAEITCETSVGFLNVEGSGSVRFKTSLIFRCVSKRQKNLTRYYYIKSTGKSEV